MILRILVYGLTVFHKAQPAKLLAITLTWLRCTQLEKDNVLLAT
jgi:hypothetical protein